MLQFIYAGYGDQEQIGKGSLIKLAELFKFSFSSCRSLIGFVIPQVYGKRHMGVKNYLIEGVSCAGKTTVCDELRRRGYHTIHGDRELAYFGDLETGEPLDDCASENRSWLWDVEKVRALAADHSHPASFFCGGSRNSDHFLDLFDEVFVLEIDLDTLNRRLAARPENEWGGTASEGESFARLQHETKEGLPRNAVIIDATAPLSSVVDAILENANQVVA